MMDKNFVLKGKKGQKNNNARCIVALFVRGGLSEEFNVQTMLANVLLESVPYGFHSSHLLILSCPSDRILYSPFGFAHSIYRHFLFVNSFLQDFLIFLNFLILRSYR